MDHLDRIYHLHRIFKSRRTPIGIESLRDEVGCSRATLYRDIAFLRDRLGAPVEQSARGHYYDHELEDSYELPGLWFSSAELQALLTIHTLLKSLDAGVLNESLGPIDARVRALLGSKAAGIANPAERIRLIGMANRDAGPHFDVCADALLNRKRMKLDYLTRSTNTRLERTVSPQRLVRYRDNWYLDAWCHTKKGLRTFSLDSIQAATKLEVAAREFGERTLDAHYADSYGIFSGRASEEAVLRFTPDEARWVSREHWHPRQKGRALPDGCYEMRIPYGNPTELIMDILRHGPNVEVIGPPMLRAVIREKLKKALSQYS